MKYVQDKGEKEGKVKDRDRQTDRKRERKEREFYLRQISLVEFALAQPEEVLLGARWEQVIQRLTSSRLCITEIYYAFCNFKN